MHNIANVKAQHAREVYEKFKEEAFLIEGFYSEDSINQTQLTIDLLQNNIEPDDLIQQH